MYLDRHFRCKLDFALENTLPSLMKDGLIRKDHQVHLKQAHTEAVAVLPNFSCFMPSSHLLQGRLQAVPMNEGIKCLTQKWTTLFNYSVSFLLTAVRTSAHVQLFADP